MNEQPDTTDIGQQLAAALSKMFPPERIAQCLASCLTAEVASRDGTIRPDHKVRLQAALAILAYKIGRPIERSEVVNVSMTADDALGLRDRLRHSPALRDALRGALVEAEDGEE